jgi:glycosyltransferase involved in cell wall biosynthesis
MPLVSVVVPTHNRPNLLAEALASVRAQTFKDYEVIVISNGESDDSRRASREVAAAHGAAYFDISEGNVAAARNFGVARGKGEWIAFLDDDDVWFPNKLELQVAEVQRTGADLVACDSVKFFPDGHESIQRVRRPDGWTYAKAISHHDWCAIPSTVIVRKQIFDVVGGFDRRPRCHDDTDMWRRISWHHTIHQMDEVLTHYRTGHPSISQNERRSLLYDLWHFAKMHIDTPRELRDALPSVGAFVVPRLVALSPEWLLSGLDLLRPRRRWAAFRQWLAGKI